MLAALAELRRDFAAAADERAAKVKELVDGGADVNETDSVGRTALMIAAKHGESEIAQVVSVTPSRISQILSRARSELQESLVGHITAGDLASSVESGTRSI